MKRENHKELSDHRVIQRGSLFYHQRNDGSKASIENDPWKDDSRGFETAEQAIKVMYTRAPLSEAAQ